MILVDNLEKVGTCPNCGHEHLDCWYNINTNKKSKYCTQCETEIFEKERDLTIFHVDFAEEPVPIGDEIGDMLLDLECEVDELPNYALTVDDTVLAEKIQKIFYKMLKVIKEIR